MGLKYYADINDSPVTGLLRQANIKTKKHLMAFSDYSWHDCPDTVRSTGEYIIFYQGGPIDHGTHVPGIVAHVLLAVSGQSFQLESEKSIKCFLVLILACLKRSVTGA